MTGRSKALDRAWAHERRRHPRSVRSAINALNDAELIRLVRGMNQVDRAVHHGQQVIADGPGYQERAA